MRKSNTMHTRRLGHPEGSRGGRQRAFLGRNQESAARFQSKLTDRQSMQSCIYMIKETAILSSQSNTYNDARS